jgi:hypothetical protein
MALRGGCLCGALRYRIDREPLGAVICHCVTCRRAAGAQAVAWATVPAAGFAWTAGTPAAYASSPGVLRGHCAACGTSLTWEGVAGEVDVTLASLDDPEAIAPDHEAWVSHRLAWTPLRSDLPGFPEVGGDA